MKRHVNIILMVMTCMLLVTPAMTWTILLDVSDPSSDTASSSGTWAEESWNQERAYAYTKVWDASIGWESGWATADSEQKHFKRYVTGSPAPTECDQFLYGISGTVYAKCNGQAANGTFGWGSCAAHGYAKVIGNASDGYDDNLKADCDGCASESGGYSVTVTIGKEGAGGGVSYTGGETYFSKTATDDLDKEAYVDGSPAPWAKLTCRAYAESSGDNGADGPQEGKGKATKNSVTITLQ